MYLNKESDLKLDIPSLYPIVPLDIKRFASNSLLKYLDFSVTDVEISETVQTKLQDGLLEFKSNHDDYPVNISLILKTTKYLISEITMGASQLGTE